MNPGGASARSVSPEKELLRALTEGEGEFHIVDIFRLIGSRWRWLVLGLLGGLALGLVQYALTPREYRATTLIQIERRISVPLQGGQDAWLESYWNTEYYPTQYRLLASRGLAERVVMDLRLFEDPEFHPGGIGEGGPQEALVAGLAGRVLGGLEINPLRNTMLVEISYRSVHPELAARIANGLAEAYIDWGIESRRETAGRASSFFAQQIESLKREIQEKENQLQAYGRRTDIVSLDPTTNVTLRKLQALNQDYINAVSERISKEARLRDLEALTVERAAEVLADPVVTAQRQELLEMEREYAVKLNLYKPDWPAMVELRARIDQVRKNLRNIVAESLSTAREMARSEYQNTLRREQALSSELARVKAESRELSSVAVEYSNLQVEVSTRRAMLDELLRRQSETEVASRLQAQGESNVRIVDRALVPGAPFRPSLRRNLLFGSTGGMGVGLALILLIHYLDRTLKTQEEAERLLGIPVLATIPDVSSAGRRRSQVYGRYGYGYGYGYGQRSARRSGEKKVAVAAGESGGAQDANLQIELLPLTRPRLAVAEAYRALRTALLLSTARELRSLVVTSALPGEGKTSTALNLAVVLAQLGKRVLLVDADLRRPRIHDVFRIVNRVGLVNFLTHSAEAEQVVFRTQVENLFLTPSGPIPPNPSELLSSERMEEFLSFVRKHFDFVVLDTAPTLAVSDGIVLGSRVDGALLCLFAGHVERREAKACRDRLVLGGVKLLGAVLNRHVGLSSSYQRGYVSSSSGAYGLESAPQSSAEEAALR